MDEARAYDAAGAWLTKLDNDQKVIDLTANLLWHAVPDVEAGGWGCTTGEPRLLAMMAGNALWIASGTLEADNLIRVELERVALDRINVSLTRDYDRKDFSPNVASSMWRFRINDGPELTFDESSEFATGLAKTLSS
jgi:hypothetical protein